jgi:Phage capsid family
MTSRNRAAHFPPTPRHDPTTDLLIFPEIRNTPPQLIGFPVTITDQIPVNLAPSTSTEILLADMSEVLIGDEMSLSIAFGCRRISR